MLKYNVHVPVHISARLYDIHVHLYRKSDVFAMFFIMFVLDYVEALKNTRKQPAIETQLSNRATGIYLLRGFSCYFKPPLLLAVA